MTTSLDMQRLGIRQPHSIFRHIKVWISQRQRVASAGFSCFLVLIQDPADGLSDLAHHKRGSFGSSISPVSGVTMVSTFFQKFTQNNYTGKIDILATDH